MGRGVEIFYAPVLFDGTIKHRKEKPMISHKAISKSRMKELVSIIVEGNLILKEFHEKVLAKKRKKAKRLKMKYGLRRFRVDLFKLIKDGGSSIEGIRFRRSGIDKICAVQEIQYEFMQGFVRMIKGRVKSWMKENESYLDLEDLESYAYSAFLDALFSYTNPKIKFITYAWHVINRRLQLEINKHRSNFPWTDGAQSLRQKFDEKSKELETQNFNTVVEALGFNDEQQSKLRAVMSAMIPMSEVTFRNNNEERPIDFPDKEEVKLDLDQKEAIEAANLTDWEKAVLKGFLSGHWGWQTEVAKEFGYSRAAPHKTLQLLKVKINKQYEKEKAA
jgi:hypothetical protein